MKFLLAILLVVLVITIDASYLRRECKCKAVSDDFGFNYHKWDISTCHLCSCSDAAMTNCETACKALVDSYAKTGCGKLVKGTNIRYKFEAEGCRKGQSTEKYVCS